MKTIEIFPRRINNKTNTMSQFCRYCGQQMKSFESGLFNEETGAKMFHYLCVNINCSEGKRTNHNIKYNSCQHDFQNTSILGFLGVGEVRCTKCNMYPISWFW